MPNVEISLIQRMSNGACRSFSHSKQLFIWAGGKGCFQSTVSQKRGLLQKLDIIRLENFSKDCAHLNPVNYPKAKAYRLRKSALQLMSAVRSEF